MRDKEQIVRLLRDADGRGPMVMAALFPADSSLYAEQVALLLSFGEDKSRTNALAQAALWSDGVLPRICLCPHVKQISRPDTFEEAPNGSIL